MTETRRLAAIRSADVRRSAFQDRHHKPGKSGMAHIHPTRRFTVAALNAAFAPIPPVR
jgi:hypothetical protein